jgi:hypothetical protein
MATTARSPPPATRRPTSSTPGPGAAAIARGATARAAVPPRVSSPLTSHARRASLKAASPPLLNGDTHGSLAESLKHETEHKELLMVQIQEKDQTITTLTAENATLVSSINAAQTRINEFYEEQSRNEVEMSNRIEISEKLRTQIRELEKERRDLQRRYNEQIATFDAERQALYDNENHLKSRIQSLTQAKKDQATREPSIIVDSESELELEEEDPVSLPAKSTRQDMDDPDSEPAEVTALKLELSTLSTSYTSLQSTVGLMQTQLMDIKRVNQELQEENESYMILLRERTLNGQFDVLKHAGGHSDDDNDEDADVGSLLSTGTGQRSVLDRVEEEHPSTLEEEFERNFELLDEPMSRQSSRAGRKRGQSTLGPTQGESLADLPITGPGLDLAAELGRAQNRDILDGKVMDEPSNNATGRRGKRSTDPKSVVSDSELELLKSEVKSLKDANKALSLYASKIIDRIIAEEGFEHVLAVDYDEQPATPVTTKAPQPSPAKATKPRPQSAIMGRSTSAPDGAPVASPPPMTFSSTAPPRSHTAGTKAQRRSLSFDWKTFSIFNNDKKPEHSNLRPLTLKTGGNTVVGARKLEKPTHEDDEDKRERERLNATMKLMGIDPAPSPVVPPSPIQNSPPTATATRRFSLFGSRTPPQATSDGLGLGISSSGLTQDALVQAEAVNALAAQDARERSLSAELSKGSPSGGTVFTEISRRSSASRRSRRSGGGSESGRSGSTVFSAGIQEE